VSCKVKYNKTRNISQESPRKKGHVMSENKRGNTHILAILGIRSKRSHAKGCGRHDENVSDLSSLCLRDVIEEEDKQKVDLFPKSKKKANKAGIVGINKVARCR